MQAGLLSPDGPWLGGCVNRILGFLALLLLSVQPGHALARPVVAIIDSGIARTDELRASLIAEYDLASLNPRPAFQPRYDHGTMVATILTRAAARPIRIISFRIDDPAGCPPRFNPPCQPDAAPVARAIRKATILKVDVINLSLALADSPSIVAAVREAAHKGIRVVIAAGNEGKDTPGNLDIARAGYPNAVLVGAVDADGRPWSGTNRPGTDSPRDFVYVWQRGVRVPTRLADGSAAFGTGTSFAAPVESARLLGHGRRLAPDSRLADAPVAAKGRSPETQGAAATGR